MGTQIIDYAFFSFIGAVGLKKTQGEGVVPPQGAISLQMQDWTDAINHPEWQRDDRVFWNPDRLYTMYSTYKFSVNREGADMC